MIAWTMVNVDVQTFNKSYCRKSKSIIKTNGERCKYKSKIDGMCSQHYKNIHKIDIKKVYDKIK